MKSVLVLMPYESIYPPTNGGMQRCFNLLVQLSKRYAVTAIMHQDKALFLQAVKEYPEFNNTDFISTKDHKPKRDLFSFLPAKLGTALRFRFWNRSLKGPADSNFILFYPILAGLLKKKQFDFVIIENLASLNTEKIIRRIDPNASIIYNAYNVDHLLLKEENEKTPIPNFEKYFSMLKETEYHLGETVNAVWACSQYDADVFKSINNKKLTVAVIPNGVDTRKSFFIEKNGNEQPTLIFCGDLNTIANRSGIIWFLDEIWPQLNRQSKSLRLLVVGKGHTHPELINYIDLENVKFLGMVQDLAAVYRQSSVMIVPLIVGSGTRLKILESLSFGIPVVGTAKAVEGINYEDGKHLFIADDIELFAGRILQLLSDATLWENMRRSGRHFVEDNFDWNIIGDKMEEALSNTPN